MFLKIVLLVVLLLISFDVKAQGVFTKDPSLVKALLKNDMNGFYELIEAGFPVNAVDENGNSALHVAAYNGNRNVVDYLIASGANPTQLNYAGESVGAVAFRGGHEQLAQYLNYASLNDNPQLRSYANQGQAQTQDYFIPSSAEKTTSGFLGSGVGSSSLSTILIGGAVIGGGIAIAAASSGGSDKKDDVAQTGGRTTPVSTFAYPTPLSGYSVNHPKSDNPNSATIKDTEYNNSGYGLNNVGGNYSLARGYDGSIYNRNGSGVLNDNIADGIIKVAIVDSAVRSTHQDLSGNIDLTNSIDCSATSCTGSGINDTIGHGSFVAGIIAGKNDGIGIQGVAPSTNIISVKLPDAGFNLNDVGKSVGYIGSLTDNDIRAINLSLGNSFETSVAGLTVEGSSASPYKNGKFATSIPIVDSQLWFDDNGVIRRILRNGIPATYRTIDVSYDSDAQGRANFNALNTDGGITNNITNEKRIFVVATGNSSLDQASTLAGLPYYYDGTSDADNGNSTVDLEPYWLAVTSVDSNNKISAFSNICGVAASWCISAPGEDVKSLSNNSNNQSYSIGSGTSFAAPYVTGAVAVLSGAFPQLQPEIIRQIILETATDLGTPGIDSVYGWGLLNLNKATDPSTGGWGVTLSGNFNSSGFAFESSNAQLTSAFGDALSNANLNLMFLDSYKKNYYIPLNSLVANKASSLSSLNMAQKLDNFGKSYFENNISLNDNLNFAYSLENKTLGDELFTRHNKTEVDRFVANFSLGSENNNLNLKAFSGIEYGSFSNFAALNGADDNNLLITSNLSNPYLGLNESSTGFAMQNENGNVSQKFLMLKGKNKENESLAENKKNESKALSYEVAYKVPKLSSVISLESGLLNEDEGFLGSNANGSFNIKDNTKTYFQNASAKYNVSDNLSLFGSYTIGLSKIENEQNSIFKSFSNVFSNAYALGFAYDGVLEQTDKLGFNYSTPLRVISGKADLSLPSGIDSSGNIVSSNYNVSLKPDGKEEDFELFYTTSLTEGLKLSLSSLLRLQPDNIESADPETVFMLKLFYEFN